MKNRRSFIIGLKSTVLQTREKRFLKRSKEDIEASLSSTLENVNTQIDHHENMTKFIVMKEEWTVENGILTPTMKIKRGDLEKLHSANYETWYDSTGEIIWQ